VLLKSAHISSFLMSSTSSGRCKVYRICSSYNLIL